jgi:hypothetical protein
MNQYDPRMARHPLAASMWRDGDRIAPSPSYERSPQYPGLPPELQPNRSPSPGMAPGMTPQQTPNAWTFLPQAPADRIIRVPNMATVAGGAIGAAQGVQWPDDGYVLWWSASPRAIDDEDAFWQAMTSLAVQIQAGDQGTYITGNGQSSDYALFQAIAEQPLLYRAVERQSTWTIQVRNYNANGAVTFVPEITFGFKSLKNC